jgi:hypothetical protein
MVLGAALVSAGGCGRQPLESVADRDAPQVTEILFPAGSTDATPTTIANRPGCTTMVRFQYAEFAVSMSTGDLQDEVLGTLEALATKLGQEVPELAVDLSARVAAAQAMASGELTEQDELRANEAQDRLTRWFSAACLTSDTAPGTQR